MNKDVVLCKECAIRYDACPMAIRAMTKDKQLLVRFVAEDDDYCSRGKRIEAGNKKRNRRTE